MFLSSRHWVFLFLFPYIRGFRIISFNCLWGHSKSFLFFCFFVHQSLKWKYVPEFLYPFIPQNAAWNSCYFSKPWDFIRAYWGGSELCVKVQQIVISAVTACGPREALGTKKSIKHDICLWYPSSVSCGHERQPTWQLKHLTSCWMEKKQTSCLLLSSLKDSVMFAQVACRST